MTPGQFVTVFTIGIAFAVGAAGIGLAAAVLLSPPFFAAVNSAAGGLFGTLPSAAVAAIIAGLGVAGAVWLTRTQQAIAGWLADRELAKLKAAYADVEMALGTEKANEYLAFKLGKLADNLERPSSDIFGEREVRDGLREVRRSA